MELDHIVVAAETLEAGVEAVEDVLGVSLDGGGKHPHMSTWNRVVALGPGEYLEVIAIDPSAPDPGRARWFAMDGFRGGPRLWTWVSRVGDLKAALAAGDYPGVAEPSSRDNLKWSFGLADDGSMPDDGAAPTLIEWQGPHPRDNMLDRGLRLQKLVIETPDAARLAADIIDDRVEMKAGPQVKIEALIDTPSGPRWLG